MPKVTDATLRRLEKAARAAAGKAYAPYSRFPVGAAVVGSSGRVYSGCNCAERTAIFSAVAAGETAVVAVVVYTPTPLPTAPCGACRQVINEFGPDALVISVCDSKNRIDTRLSALLPGAFGPGDLA